MKKIIAILGVLAIASSAMAASVSYWDDGFDDNSYKSAYNLALAGSSMPDAEWVNAGTEGLRLDQQDAGTLTLSKNLNDGVIMPTDQGLIGIAGQGFVEMKMDYRMLADASPSENDLKVSMIGPDFYMSIRTGAIWGTSTLWYNINGAGWNDSGVPLKVNPAGVNGEMGYIFFDLAGNGNVKVGTEDSNVVFTGAYPLEPVSTFELIAGTTDTTATSYVDHLRILAPGTAPIPEPATMLLLGIGLPFLARRRRR